MQVFREWQRATLDMVVKEVLSDMVTFERRIEISKREICGWTYEGYPGTGNSKCTDAEIAAYMAYWRYCQEIGVTKMEGEW